ncbi:MAG: TPM domain-containing protein [Bacteroidota bacterium]
MKHFLLILLLLPCFAFAQRFPDKPSNYITDAANVLSDDEERQLNAKLRSFEDSTTNQLFIFTAASLYGDNLEVFTQELFKEWQIGQSGKDNGILITIFVDDHKFRIQTGYGLEAALPDLLTKHIQDNDMRPSFKNNAYYEGIDKGIDKLIYYSKHEFNPDDLKESPVGFFIFFYMFGAIFLTITLLLAKGIKDNPTVKKTLIIVSIITFLIPIVGTMIVFITIFVAVSYRKDLLKDGTGGSGSSSWSSSSSGSWSSGSSFSGGGGGRSGGGGSSSSW